MDDVFNAIAPECNQELLVVRRVVTSKFFLNDSEQMIRRRSAIAVLSHCSGASQDEAVCGLTGAASKHGITSVASGRHAMGTASAA